MLFARRSLLALALTAVALGAAAQQKKEIVFGATAGPYSDQVRLGIKPILEKKGYSVKIVEFNDYIQPNHALAQGALDANAFQHIVYLTKFATENKLAISELLKVPTAPIAVYSRKHRSLTEVKEGATVALPNDPTNAARALVVLEQLGWIKLKDGTDPIRASEKDVAVNIRKIRLVPIEAAQLPRSLGDTEYAIINGNFAISSGLKLTEAVALEKTPDHYLNVVAVKSADKNTQWAKDLSEIYRSKEFKAVVDSKFQGYAKPSFLQ